VGHCGARQVCGRPTRQLRSHGPAAEITVAETTVKTHVARILAKLGVRDRVQAVVLAYESGFVGRAR
jgi:hypothetical protein